MVELELLDSIDEHLKDDNLISFVVDCKTWREVLNGSEKIKFTELDSVVPYERCFVILEKFGSDGLIIKGHLTIIDTEDEDYKERTNEIRNMIGGDFNVESEDDEEEFNTH